VFIERLNNLLEERGISANKMSKDLGLGSSAYTHWKNRGNLPSGDVIQKLADYFDVSTDYLLGRTDEPNFISKHAASTVGNIEYDDLPEEAMEEMENYREYLREKYKKK